MTQTGRGCLHEAMLGLAVQDMPRTGSHLHQLAQIRNISNGSRECSRVGRKSPHRCISSPAAGCLFAHRIYLCYASMEHLARASQLCF